MIVIADIDGVILDSVHRLSYFLSGDLSTYDALYTNDVPMPAGCSIYKKFITDASVDFVFITGRAERTRGYTAAQLDNLFPNCKYDLLMRPDEISGDLMHDAQLKPFLLERSGRKLKDVLVAFDDRASVVKAWRELGVTCYQADVGDF